MLERLFWNTGLLIARVRYGRMPGSLHRNRPPSPGPNHGARR
jgi:hypothetical protein